MPADTHSHGLASRLCHLATRNHAQSKRMEAGLIAAAFSLATLALSRCRCVVRRTESGGTEYGAGFSEHQLLPERTKPIEKAPE
jgi:hypothetical protein